MSGGRKLAHYADGVAARRAFLAELKQCGDVRVACREARVSKSWAYTQRARRPRFAQKWTHALDTWWRNKPERDRERLHQLDPYNPDYWSTGQLMQAIRRMRQHWRAVEPAIRVRQPTADSVRRKSPRSGLLPMDVFDEDC